ncbi:DUF3043 domain-containing protein [Microbacterium sp. 67-17]|uniref:DUF3043 domain-containing protein n=1 Tax=unclassified Microbacterium TaxID=2609290 RepID=UPI0009633D3E|nr:DUF3043 domain-containing protein [Microbacterium sp. 67-17]OJW01417.1 MAG: hypothetical protein BGO47_13205 [Microbacterium sp. 67-17]
MAKTPAPEAPKDASTSTVGKGKATPSRAEQEAARKRPLVPDTKEAKAQRKAELASARERARIGMANGEQKYLPARDQGPQRKFARDFVDAGWHLGEAVMPAMVVVIVATFIPLQFIQYWAFVALWVFIFFVIGDMIITSIRVKRAVRDKFGESKVEKGLGWYASMRSVQMRFMRLPKAQVRRGQYPS